MNIAFYIQDMNGGGAERVVLELISSLIYSDHSIFLFLNKYEGELIVEASSLCDNIVIINSSTSFFSTLSFSAELNDKLISNNISVLISNLTGLNRLVSRSFFIRNIQIPLLLVEHNDMSIQLNARGLFARLRSLLVKYEINFLYRLASTVICVSYGVEESILKNISNGLHTTVILNPVSFDKISELSNKKPDDLFLDSFLNLPQPVIISMGSLTKQKNFRLLIKSVSLIENFNGTLVILGDGPERTNLEQYAFAHDVNLHLPGFLSNPFYYLKHSKLYVMSSSWEGYPLSLIQAIFAGLFVISTDCNYGPREILSKNLGSLVPINDTLSLMEAIEQYLESPDIISLDLKSKELTLLKNKLNPKHIASKYIKACYGN